MRSVITALPAARDTYLEQVRLGYSVLGSMQHVIRPVDGKANGLPRAPLCLDRLVNFHKLRGEVIPSLLDYTIEQVMRLAGAGRGGGEEARWLFRSACARAACQEVGAGFCTAGACTSTTYNKISYHTTLYDINTTD